MGYKGDNKYFDLLSKKGIYFNKTDFNMGLEDMCRISKLTNQAITIFLMINTNKPSGKLIIHYYSVLYELWLLLRPLALNPTDREIMTELFDFLKEKINILRKNINLKITSNYDTDLIDKLEIAFSNMVNIKQSIVLGIPQSGIKSEKSRLKSAFQSGNASNDNGGDNA